MRFLSLFHLDSPRLVWVIVSRMSSRWHPNYEYLVALGTQFIIFVPGTTQNRHFVIPAIGYPLFLFPVAPGTEILSTWWHWKPKLFVPCDTGNQSYLEPILEMLSQTDLGL